MQEYQEYTSEDGRPTIPGNDDSRLQDERDRAAAEQAEQALRAKKNRRPGWLVFWIVLIAGLLAVGWLYVPLMKQ